eukprot:121139-Karenia_brevis.AAC.1
MRSGCQNWGVHSRSTQNTNLGASALCVPASYRRSFARDMCDKGTVCSPTCKNASIANTGQAAGF